MVVEFTNKNLQSFVNDINSYSQLIDLIGYKIEFSYHGYITHIIKKENYFEVNIGNIILGCIDKEDIKEFLTALDNNKSINYLCGLFSF